MTAAKKKDDKPKGWLARNKDTILTIAAIVAIGSSVIGLSAWNIVSTLVAQPETNKNFDKRITITEDTNKAQCDQIKELKENVSRLKEYKRQGDLKLDYIIILLGGEPEKIHVEHKKPNK